MVHWNRWMVVALVAAGPPLFGCGGGTAKAKSSKVEPAKVERLEGGIAKVTLTEKAAERLDIKTGAARVPPSRKGEGEGVAPVTAPGNAAGRIAVPYASIVYEPHGETWVYTNPKPLTFVRERVQVDYIDGDLAILSKGPAAGTAVVTVGVPELFGIDFGVK